MTLAAADKGDEDLRIDARAALALKVWTGGKGKPVGAGWSILRQIAATTVGVRFSGRDRRPSTGLAPVEFMPLEPHGNSGGRFAQCRVQNVCCDFTHGSAIFPIGFE